jgi:hypothetical protein
MKVTRSQLKKIIQEELDESFMEPGGFGVSHPKQKKISSGSSVDDAEKRFIDSVINHKYKALEHKERKSLVQRLAMSIDKAITGVLEKFTPTPIGQLQEVAPPGMEDKVKALKKKLCDGKDDCPQAFKIAWSEYNEKK